MTQFLNSPYGGELVDLQESGERQGLIRHAASLPTVRLSPRQLEELAMLACGMLSPLDRYLNRAELNSVVNEMSLPDGTLFPYPLLLDIATVEGLHPGDWITLRNAKNNPVAWMEIEEIFEIPASKVLSSRHGFALSGRPRVIDVPRSPDFSALRRTPAEMRWDLARSPFSAVVAFSCSGPMSESDERVLNNTAQDLNAAVVVHPALNTLKPFDIKNFLHTRICATVVERYIGSRGRVLLRPSPSATDPLRNLLLDLIVHRNYGATHVLGDAAEFDVAAKLVPGVWTRIGVQPIANSKTENPGKTTRNLHPETQALMARVYPEQGEQGFCLWLTGLPSAGKSTIAELVATALLERGRQVTILDGDVVRTHLSRGLGFSREDRDVNVLRIGFVAAEIVRHHGVVICAVVSPYRETRNKVRHMIGDGRFVEIFVDAPLSVCEARDVKGYYAQARAGSLASFTGVSDPYEPPEHCEVPLNSSVNSQTECAEAVIRYLTQSGFLPAGNTLAMRAAAR